MRESTITRRALLGSAAPLTRVGCAEDERTARLRRLERRFDARLGV